MFSQDFTVRGGSIGRNHGKKIARIIEMAIEAKKPVVGIYDSGGAGIDEGVSSLAGCGDMMYQNICASGVVHLDDRDLLTLLLFPPGGRTVLGKAGGTGSESVPLHCDAP